MSNFNSYAAEEMSVCSSASHSRRTDSGVRTTRRIGQRSVSIGLAVGLLGTGALTAASVAQASTVSHKALTPIQKGYAALKGKTIDLLVGGAGGTAYDVQTRALAVPLGKELDATINVEDIPAGGGVTEMDQLAHSQPNGLTMGVFSLGNIFYDQLTNVPSINFNVAREDLLGINGADPQLLLTLPNSPYQTFGSLVNNPATISTAMYTSHTATEDILLSRVFGVKEHYVFGYTSAVLEFTGFLRGDAQLVVDGPAAVQSAVQAGQAKVLAVLNTKATNLTSTAPAFVKAAPTLPQLEKKYPPKAAQAKTAEALLNAVINVPNASYGLAANTPTDIYDAWQQAFKRAETSAYVTGIELASGDFGGVVPVPVIKAALKVEESQFKAIQTLGGF